jgi:hypothetical protein
MKKGIAGFKERYGSRAKNVMYATATKQAMKLTNMKKFKEMLEQHREKGRFHPVKPYNVQNTAAASPRPSSDSASVKLKEDLRKWFSKTDPAGDWKRINSKGEAIGPCAREPGEPKPKCMSKEKRESLTKKERASAVRAKRKHDPNPERKGEPINVSNFGKGKISEDMENLDEKNVPTSPEKWAQAKAQAKAKFDVYPSAYANGWAAKKYKAMGGGWKSVSEETLEEGRPSQRHPLEGHEYHKKTNAELEYIAKDAHKAAEAMKSHNTDAENKYRDQANDSATVRHFRKTSGMPNWYKKKYGHISEENSLLEKWSQKYKSSIDCDNPKGFSQKAHCDGKEKNEEVVHEGAIPAKEKTVTVKHKTSGKELVVTAQKAKELKQQDYHPVKEAKEVGDEQINDGTPEGLVKRGGKTMFIKPLAQEAKDVNEYDQEGDMAKSDLRSIMANAKRVHDMLEDSDNLPEWVQSKITKAEDYMSTVANYLSAEMSEEVDAAIGLAKPKTSLTPAAKTLAPQTRVAEGSKPPFDKPYTTIKGVITDKSGAKHTPMSRARDIARMAMKKQAEKMKQPVKESLDESRRMEIVREAMKVAKKKKETVVSDDKYQAEPMLSSQITKT